MTRDFEQTLPGAEPSLDLRVCVEHGSIFIYQGWIDSRPYDWDDLILIEPAQVGDLIAALREARHVVAAMGGPA
jgi:hypothetical protein